MTFAQREDRIDWIVKFTEYKREQLKLVSDEEISVIFKDKVVKRQRKSVI